VTSDQLATPLDDVAAMRLALDAARDAGRAGDVPVGAVALHHGSLLAVAGNARERRHDPTAHAELEVLRAAAAALSTWRLDDVTVVVTLEPCAMCAGALVAARIGRLVLGALDTKAGAAGSLYNLLCDPRLNHEVPVTYGVLEAECAEVLRTFFAERRAP
jgi:tRNA(adenine34) deaminase